MHARRAPTLRAPTASIGAEWAASWSTRFARPANPALELAQAIGQKLQRLGRFVWRQENEVVDVATEALALLQWRRQVGQIGRLLELLDRELVDLLQAALAHVVAAVAEVAEIGLGARQSAGRQALIHLHQHARLAATDRLDRAVQHGLLMAFDVDLDEADLVAIDVVQAVHRHFDGAVGRIGGRRLRPDARTAGNEHPRDTRP